MQTLYRQTRAIFFGKLWRFLRHPQLSLSVRRYVELVVSKSIIVDVLGGLELAVIQHDLSALVGCQSEDARRLNLGLGHLCVLG